MNPPAEPTMLVLRALHLGDLLVVVPALRALRRHYPQHRIVLATPAALIPLARWSDAVDEVLPTATLDDLRWPGATGPTVAVNLHGAGPQSHAVLDATGPRERIGFRAPGWAGPDWQDVEQHHPHERERWCALLEAFGIPADPEDLRLAPPPEVDRLGVAPVIVHPGAQYGAKRWPVQRFAQVARHLHRSGSHVVVTGTAVERPPALGLALAAGLPARQVLAGRTDIAQLATLVAGAELVICGDTGIAHLASAFGTPSVVLFGPAPAQRWGPPASGPHVALSEDTARRGEPFVAEPDPALLGVEVDDVLAAVAMLRSQEPATLPAATRSNRVVERPAR